MLYWQNTTFQIKDAGVHTAILPLAAVEHRGPNLPVGSELLIVDAVARQVAEKMGDGVYLLPTLPYGNSANQGGAGTMWLTPTTLMHLVRDVVESLLAQGIRRVAVINRLGGAGESSVKPQGNYVVKSTVRQLNYDHQELHAVWVQPLTAGRKELLELFPRAEDDLHAGAVETSILLHLREELVKGRGADFVPPLSKEFLDYLPFSSICPSGVWGHPSQASAELGERALAAAVRGTAAYIQESLGHLERIKQPK